MRFPGFTDEWKQYAIDELAEIYGRIGFRGYTTADLVEKGNGAISLSPSNIIDNHLYTDKDNTYISYYKYEESPEIKIYEGDVIFVKTGSTVGKVAFVDKLDSEATLNPQLVVFKQIKCDNYLFSQIMATTKIQKIISKITVGGAVPTLSQSELGKVRISLPDKNEQQIISSLLASIDERIATQNKIIEDLKKLKSAIIDKLYSEVIGKEYSYSELFSIVTERNTNRTYSKVIAASQEYGMIERDSLNLKVQFDDSSLHTYKIIHPGDYVIHLRSFQGGYAFSRLKGICRPAYVILRPHESVEYGYFEHYFNSTKFVNSLRLVTYGIRDGRSINVDEWMSMKVVLPSNEEQDKIIRTIQSIDSKLENEKKIFTLLSQQRQFLLRQLFI